MYPQSGTSSRPSRRGSGRSSSGSSTSRRFSKAKRRREHERRGEEDSRRQLRGRAEGGGGGLPGGLPGDQLEGREGEVRGAAQARGPVSPLLRSSPDLLVRDHAVYHLHYYRKGDEETDRREGHREQHRRDVGQLGEVETQPHPE